MTKGLTKGLATEVSIVEVPVLVEVVVGLRRPLDIEKRPGVPRSLLPDPKLFASICSKFPAQFKTRSRSSATILHGSHHLKPKFRSENMMKSLPPIFRHLVVCSKRPDKQLFTIKESKSGFYTRFLSETNARSRFSLSQRHMASREEKLNFLC